MNVASLENETGFIDPEISIESNVDKHQLNSTPQAGILDGEKSDELEQISCQIKSMVDAGTEDTSRLVHSIPATNDKNLQSSLKKLSINTTSGDPVIQDQNLVASSENVDSVGGINLAKSSRIKRKYVATDKENTNSSMKVSCLY